MTATLLERPAAVPLLRLGRWAHLLYEREAWAELPEQCLTVNGLSLEEFGFDVRRLLASGLLVIEMNTGTRRGVRPDGPAAPDVQVFLPFVPAVDVRNGVANVTPQGGTWSWIKPFGARWVVLHLQGPGGGGGGGAVVGNTTATPGGGGGGSGAYSRAEFHGDDLAQQVPLAVGAGGAGGASGSNATAPTSDTFFGGASRSVALLYAAAAGSGATAGTAGGAGTQMHPGSGGGAGVSGANGAAGGGNSTYPSTPTSGAGGGGLSAANATFAGGAAGIPRGVTNAAGASGLSGPAGGGAGGNGFPFPSLANSAAGNQPTPYRSAYPAFGGGGGGSSASGAGDGGRGGHGGPGAGAGGGGAATTGALGGTGGNGGDGYCLVVAW